jgi:hypothetical protein
MNFELYKNVNFMPEFYILKKRYFVTTRSPHIQTIPKLTPYAKEEDRYWFCTQGLAVFEAEQSVGN